MPVVIHRQTKCTKCRSNLSLNWRESDCVIELSATEFELRDYLILIEHASKRYHFETAPRNVIQQVYQCDTKHTIQSFFGRLSQTWNLCIPYRDTSILWNVLSTKHSWEFHAAIQALIFACGICYCHGGNDKLIGNIVNLIHPAFIDRLQFFNWALVPVWSFSMKAKWQSDTE